MLPNLDIFHFILFLLFLLFLVLTFGINLKDANYNCHWNRLALVNNKNLGQIWIYPIEKCLILLYFHILSVSVIKLENLNVETQWNASIFFYIKDTTLDLNMSHKKISDFVSFPLFRITLLIKPRDFSFKSQRNT